MNDLASSAPNFLLILASVCALACALAVPLSRNPVVSAVALMGTLFSTAGIYFSLGNYFLGAVQILVYAGAIAVLFVFIVMLLDLKPSMLRFVPGRKPFLIFSFFVSFIMGAALLCSFLNVKIIYDGLFSVFSANDISANFISKYGVAFQAAGLLVFGAILGAVVMARGHLGKESK